MNINFKLNRDKKAMIALETLLGLIISVIVLFFIFQVFFNAFFQTPTNLKIAEDNAKSIVEFVDYSYDKYNNINDCYTMLKLSNLENYQFKDEKGKNYFYLIDNLGVNVIKFDNYENIRNKKLNLNLYEKKINFKTKNLELKFDETNQGNNFLVEMYFWSFGESEKELLLNNELANLLILKPEFGGDFLGIETNIVSENQNILYGETLINNDFIKNEGLYLIFKPYTRQLFLSKSSFSEALIKNKNCALKSFSDNHLKNNYYNVNNVDYINYELTFDAIIDNKEQNFIFKWSISNIECPNKDCNKYLGNDYSKLTFQNFVEKLKENYNDQFKSLNFELKIIDKKYIGDKINSIEKLKLYPVEFIFNKIEDNNLKFTQNEINFIGSEKFFENKLESFAGDLVFYDFKKYRIDCNLLICDYFIFKNNIVYFYDNDVKSFVSIRGDLFRKNEKGKLIYAGKEYEIKIQDFDDVQTSVFKDNLNFYIFNIDTNKGLKTIIMSPGQFNSLENVK